jgi:hypothetical protein
MYTFVPEAAVTLKVGKMLGKLSNDAVPGPSGLRNSHIEMWMRAFASDRVDEAIDHLEDLITNMATTALIHASHAENIITCNNQDRRLGRQCGGQHTSGDTQ